MDKYMHKTKRLEDLLPKEDVELLERLRGTVTFRGRVFKDATMRIKEDEIKLSDELNNSVDDSVWDQFVKMALHYSGKFCKKNGIR